MVVPIIVAVAGLGVIVHSSSLIGTGNRELRPEQTTRVRCQIVGMSECQGLRVDRMRWAGPLTVLASVGAVAIIREIAVIVVQPGARYIPLLRPFPILDTAV